jgi:ribonuclease Z
LRIYTPPHVKKVVKLVTSHFVAETVSTPYKTTFRRVSFCVLLDLPGLRVEVAEACYHTAKEAYAHRLSAGVDVLFSGDTAPRCEPLRRPGAGVDVAVLEATRNEENKPLCKRVPTPPPSRRWRRGGHEGGGTGDYTQMAPT